MSWRAVYPARAEETDAEIVSPECAQARLQRFFPTDGPYEIIHTNLYKVHQRLAETSLKGRILSAGDASHVNPPEESGRSSPLPGWSMAAGELVRSTYRLSSAHRSAHLRSAKAAPMPHGTPIHQGLNHPRNLAPAG